MLVVGIRGAITVANNDRDQILAASTEMVLELMKKNGLTEDDLISLFFTMTPDLDAAFPAEAVRRCGITETPLMCAPEIPVLGSLAKCIRVLAHCQGKLKKSEVRHIYLADAVALRPDLVEREVSQDGLKTS